MFRRIFTKGSIPLGGYFLVFSVLFAAMVMGGHAFSKPQSIAQESSLAPPVQLLIPKLELTVKVEAVGKASDGTMATPTQVEDVAWWKLGAVPGEMGSAVMAGHVDTPDGKKGIFFRLGELKVGDQVIVTAQDGKTQTFEVFAVETYPAATFPLTTVFGKKDGRYLNLITCAGAFDVESKNYENRLVVFTRAIN